MAEINFPNDCSEKSVFRFCSKLDDLSSESHVIIDFSSMGRIEPFMMLYLAYFIWDYRQRTKDQRLTARGHKEKTYAAHMGFFKAAGLSFGNEPGEAPGSAQYIPLTILRTEEITDEAATNFTEAQQVVENRAGDLARILTRNKEGDLLDALTYSVREIIRNVIEHSESEFVAYCGQYWPMYDKVEIAIIDGGMGLENSLRQNPYISVTDNSEALQLALMPAISSKTYKGVRSRKDDPWQNSGYGLYMTSRLCRLGGNFLIVSGDHAIRLDEVGKTHIDLGHFYEGTAIRMVLDTSRLGTLSSMMEGFRKEGYEIAKEFKGAGTYKASTASQMLSKDFK